MEKDQQRHWDLTPLLTSESDEVIAEEQGQIKKNVSKIVNKWNKDKGWTLEPEQLKEALDDYEEFERDLGSAGKAGYYFSLKSRLDQNDPQIKAQVQKLTEFHATIANQLHFFVIAIGKTPEHIQQEHLKNPKLAKYHTALHEIYKEAKHLLTEEVEQILTLKSNPAHALWEDLTQDLLAKEEGVINKETKHFTQLASLVDHQDKEIRTQAAKEMQRILEKHKDVATAEINAILTNKKIDDQLRGYKYPDDPRINIDGIDKEFITTLLDAVEEQYNIAHDFYRLKAQLLGIKQLTYPEKNITYTIGTEKKYTYNQAIKLIEEVFNNIDPEFKEIASQLNNNNQIDTHPSKGKYHGAFCINNTKTMPTYILLNHTDKLRDVLTLAHELGHAINSELMRKEQHAIYFETPLSTAEVASTFFEGFVFDKLLEEADKETQLSLLIQQLNDEISTILRQVACYKFELELHEQHGQKGYLSTEEIGKLFNKHMTNYLGNAIKQEKETEQWWIHWSHIRSFFYVYSYASGLLISKALQAKVKEEKKYVQSVKQFLSAGSSKRPREIFQDIGIPINKELWKQGLSEVKAKLKQAEQLAKDLEKI